MCYGAYTNFYETMPRIWLYALLLYCIFQSQKALFYVGGYSHGSSFTFLEGGRGTPMRGNTRGGGMAHATIYPNRY